MIICLFSIEHRNEADAPVIILRTLFFTSNNNNIGIVAKHLGSPSIQQHTSTHFSNGQNQFLSYYRYIYHTPFGWFFSYSFFLSIGFAKIDRLLSFRQNRIFKWSFKNCRFEPQFFWFFETSKVQIILNLNLLEPTDFITDNSRIYSSTTHTFQLVV